MSSLRPSGRSACNAAPRPRRWDARWSLSCSGSHLPGPSLSKPPSRMVTTTSKSTKKRRSVGCGDGRAWCLKKKSPGWSGLVVVVPAVKKHKQAMGKTACCSRFVKVGFSCAPVVSPIVLKKFSVARKTVVMRRDFGGRCLLLLLFVLLFFLALVFVLGLDAGLASGGQTRRFGAAEAEGWPGNEEQEGAKVVAERGEL